MEAQKSETHEIRTSQDVVSVRQAVRRCAVELGFNLVDQTKIVTASSELARNTLDYGGGGCRHGGNGPQRVAGRSADYF
jgi:serine/threonine-protein kinase RsbT